MRGQVVYVDVFGNLATNIDATNLPASIERVEIGARSIPRFVTTYGRVATGELLALVNSWGVLEIARRDAAWIWGSHGKEYSLRHSWLSNDKPNNMARNNIKYLKVDTGKRAALRAQWNQPIVWPIILIVLALVASALPAVLSYRRRERMAARPAA